MVESIGKGSDLEILERTKNFFDKEISKEYTDNICYDFYVVIAYPTKTIEEMGDSELRALAMQSGSYKFWDDPSEDIYSLEDGEPV